METPKILIRNSPNEEWKSVAIDDARRISESLYIYASGCTALTELKAEAAKTIDARGCTALTELKAEAAKTIYASGCTALTELKAEAANLRKIGLGENSHELIADLRPWREEMAEAEKIFRSANPKIGDWCAWIHHEIAFERLEEPWENRFAYIAAQKPEYERAWRFRLIRPASVEQINDAVRGVGQSAAKQKVSR